jgi:hypothetical protein
MTIIFTVIDFDSPFHIPSTVIYFADQYITIHDHVLTIALTIGFGTVPVTALMQRPAYVNP